MVLSRWDPFRELRRMEGTVDRLWQGLGPYTGGPTSDVESWGIPLDIVREGDDIVVHASVPGIKPQEVSVTIEENVLTVTGHTEVDEEQTEGTYLMRERRTGSFRRSLRLPDYVDADKAESTYEAGVLTITLPRVEAKKAKQLTVEVKEAEGKALAGAK
jgi:HSP20 family protein